MAQSVLEILLRIKDHASSELAKFDKTLEKTGKDAEVTGKSASKLAAVMKGALIAGAAAAGYALVQFSRKASQTASEVEEMSSKFDIVFGESAKAAREELERFGDEVGRSELKLMGMASTLQDTFVPMGMARDQAADLSVELVKLGTDVASFNNYMDTDVLRDFQAALVGQSETVRKYGIVITEARVKQVAYAEGIAKEGEELTELQKLQARMAILYSDTSDAQGDAARTSDSLANRERALADSIYELEAAWGEMINSGVVQRAVELGIDATNSLTESLSGFDQQLTAIQELRKAYKAGTITLDEYNKMMYEQVLWGNNLDEILKTLEERTGGLSDAEKDELSVKQKFIAAMKKTREATVEVEDTTDKWTQALMDQGMTLKEAEKALNDLAEETENLTGYQAELAFNLYRTGLSAKDAAEKALELTYATGEAARAASQLREELDKAATSAFFDVDMGFGETAAAAIDVLNFKDAGGAAGAALVEGIKQALVLNQIDEATARTYLEKVIVAAEGIKVTLGEQELKDAAKNLEETLGISAKDARKLIDDEMKKPLDLTQMQKSFDKQFTAMEERKKMLQAAGELPVEVDPNDEALTRLEMLKDAADALVEYRRTLYVDVVLTGPTNWLTERETKKTIFDDNRAGGGYVSPYNAYLVGERGPELFVPSGGGNIVPNHRLGAGGRNVTINQHFYNEGSAALGLAMVDEYSGRRLDASMGG